MADNTFKGISFQPASRNVTRADCYLNCAPLPLKQLTLRAIRARFDERLKEEAAAVLAAMGLTVSDAFRLTMAPIAQDKAPPEPLAPNAETVVKAARR